MLERKLLLRCIQIQLHYIQSGMYFKQTSCNQGHKIGRKQVTTYEYVGQHRIAFQQSSMIILSAHTVTGKRIGPLNNRVTRRLLRKKAKPGKKAKILIT